MGALKQFTCLLILIVAALIPVYAQSSENSIQEDKVVITSNLVTVNVIVSDKKGRYVKGLSSDQFSIYDENVTQKIANFSVGAAGVSLGIVCEIHSTAPDRVASMLAALEQFVSTLGPKDTFFFTAFSPDGSITTNFIPSKDQVINHLFFVKPDGPSDLYDVVYAAADRLRQSRNLKRALLVISDGLDNTSKHSYNQLRNRLREFDAQIYTVGIADPALDLFTGFRRWSYEDFTRQTGRRSFPTEPETATGRAVLAEMSKVSGGTTYASNIESEPELTGICSQITRELREQYTLSFYPSEVTTGKWHRLKLRVDAPKNSGLSLSYRQGYQIMSPRASVTTTLP
jgi:Ca-activated chloride channel family protein